jgi:hypothetical protein
MTTLQAAWGAALIASLWFVPVATIRVLAYRSGEVDHTKGMRTVAVIATVGAVVSVGALVVLTLMAL